MDHIKAFDETPCPQCGKLHDSSENADDAERKPEPGDPSICNRCAFVAVFNDEMQLVRPDRETIERWDAEPGLWKAIDDAVNTVIRRIYRR